ncbi:MAG: IS110 family transposase [Planctomycetota bacterium]|jgi:transposase
MERYLGCDVHAKSCTFCVLSQAGKKIRQDVVETNGRALLGYLRQIPGRLQLIIEEGEWSHWLYEILSPQVAELVVYRARWTPGPKSDALDAHGLAEKLRTGQVGRPVYKNTGRFTALREAARTYGMVTRDVARTRNRIKSFYRSRGVLCSGNAVYKPGHRDKLARQLPMPTRRSVQLFGHELDVLVELKAEAEKRMLQESYRHRIARVLETGPGFGPVRVAQLLPVVVTPFRFPTKREFWSYCGFGIVTRSSSDWVRENGQWVRARVTRTRGLAFSHNRLLKAIFKGAATTILAHSGPNPLQEDYERLLENGTKPNLAKVTIARKIAAIILAMWKTQEKYKQEKGRPTENG